MDLKTTPESFWKKTRSNIQKKFHAQLGKTKILREKSEVDSPIFLQLSLVQLGVAVLVAGALFGFMRLVWSVNQPARLIQNQNRSQYAIFLTDRLGTPPSLEKIRALSAQLNLQIQVTGPNFRYSTFVDPIDYPALQKTFSVCEKNPDVSIGKLDAKLSETFTGKKDPQFFAEVRTGDYRFLYAFPCDAFAEGRPELIPWLLLTILLILFCSFLWTRKLFQPQVQQLKALIQSQEQLLYDISHELRSPVTRIKVALELKKNPEELKAKIQKNLGQLEKMLQNLLEAARLKLGSLPVHCETILLTPLLNDLVEAYQDQSPGVRWAAGSEELAVKADPQLAYTAIKNVLENALKYSAAQTRPVEIEVRQTPHGTVEISIQDYGIGIPLEEQFKIFESFYRIDKARGHATGGYGLGLSLTRQLMKAQDGTIELMKSTPAETTFKLTFPLAHFERKS